MSSARERWQRMQLAHFAKIREDLTAAYDHMSGVMQLTGDGEAQENVKAAFRAVRDEIGDFFTYQLGVDVSKATRSCGNASRTMPWRRTSGRYWR
jgi:hypothetical protein